MIAYAPPITRRISSESKTEILYTLLSSDVQAVILENFWPEPALRFAKILAQSKRPIMANRLHFYMLGLVAARGGKDAEIFRTSLERLITLFRGIGAEMNLQNNFIDISRVENGCHRKRNGKPGNWHEDGPQLIMLSVLSGQQTEYLNMPVVNVHDTNHLKLPKEARLSNHIRTINPGDVVIMKGSTYPYVSSSQHGLIHRRPLISRQAKLGRLVIHCNLNYHSFC